MAETVILHCEGSSDDTFGIYGQGAGRGIADDYDNCASGKPIAFRVSAEGESLIVVGQYAPGECAGWLIGVAPDSPADDGDEVPIPTWPMRFERSDREYSPRLVIEAPAGVRIRCIVPGYEADDE